MEPNSQEPLERQREGHAVIMLVGVFVAVLLAGAVLVGLEFAPVFKATAPSPLKTDAPKSE